MNASMKALLEGFGGAVERECERGNEAIAAAMGLAGVSSSRLAPTKQQVSRPFPSWNRSILTEIYLCHACSCQ
jgi:hypothetical protein